MGIYSKDEMLVVQKTYDLIREVVPVIHRFPKNFRFSLGMRMENALYDVLDGLMRAKFRSKKREILNELNLRLESLRFQIRLARDFGIMSFGAYGKTAEGINEVGRLIGGWLKKVAE